MFGNKLFLSTLALILMAVLYIQASPSTRIEGQQKQQQTNKVPSQKRRNDKPTAPPPTTERSTADNSNDLEEVTTEAGTIQEKKDLNQEQPPWLKFCLENQHFYQKEEAVPQLIQLVVAVIGILSNAAGVALRDQKEHLGNSHRTQLEIENQTDGPIHLKVSEIDNHDWNGDSRPDHNFQDSTIEAHQTKSEREEINAKSSTAMSTMTVSQDDKEQFSMRVNQWDAMADETQTKDFDMENGYKVKMTGGEGTLKLSISK